jgi:hypothetical protein
VRAQIRQGGRGGVVHARNRREAHLRGGEGESTAAGGGEDGGGGSNGGVGLGFGEGEPARELRGG